jgi:hypothetical protein
MRAYCKRCNQWVFAEQTMGGAAPVYHCTMCGGRCK